MIAIIDIDVNGNKVNAILVISSKYADLAFIFSEDATNILSGYWPHDLQLETTGISPFRLIYNPSQNEFKIF